MKHAKKAAALIAAFLLSTVMAAAACAAEGSRNVWIDAVPDSGTEETLTVPLKTDGTAVEGLVVLTYDPEVLAVSGEDVSPAGVELYSANVTEAGTLKMSWIAGDAPKAGTLLEVPFRVLEKNADPGLGLVGEVYGADQTASGAGSVGVAAASSCTASVWM